MKKTKIKHKSTKVLRKRAWNLISEYLRRSAANEHGIVLCYTCGKSHYWTDMDLGHYIHKDCLDFTEINLHPQCSYCNRRMHGNSALYAERLINEYGLDVILELRAKSEIIKKFTVGELEDLIRLYTERLKTLEGK